jgi:hypothetical protein
VDAVARRDHGELGVQIVGHRDVHRIDPAGAEQLVEPVVREARRHVVALAELLELVARARDQRRDLDIVELRDRREHRCLCEVPQPDHTNSKSR